jgi:GNAT superfamily N-acetyltransferase
MSNYNNIKIRQAEVLDLPNLKSLWLEFMEYHESLGQKYQFFLEDWPNVINRFTHALQKEQSTIFIAELHNKIVGYVFGFIFDNFPGYYPKEVAFINDFIVTKKMRKQGIGTELLKSIERWFHQQDKMIVQLYVASPNTDGFQFWQHHGFDKFLVGMWKEISK